MTVFTLTMNDAKSQQCSFTLPMTQMTAANHDTLITNASLVADLVLAVSAAAETGNAMNHSVTKNAAYTRPTSGYANRENAVIVSLLGDTSGKTYSVSIPAPDMDKWPFNVDGKEIYDAPFSGLHVDVQLVIDALNAHFRGNDEETATVTRFRFVGRNL